MDLQLQKKRLLSDYKHHDSLLDLYRFHYMYRRNTEPRPVRMAASAWDA